MIRTIPNEILRQVCTKESNLDLARDVVLLLLKECKGVGVGLAAPQIGYDNRIFVAEINGKLTPFINPEITLIGEPVYESTEGCLSIPNTRYKVKRHVSCAVKWSTLEGHERTKEFFGFEAIVIQHENDHLDGILICDKGIKVS